MLKGIPIYSVITFVTAILCFSQGYLVYAKNPKPLTNKLFFLFCLCADIWLIAMSLVTSKFFSKETSLMLGRVIFTGVVFLPTLSLHFSIAFLGKNVPSQTRTHLRIAYFLTFIFLLLVWTSNQFLSGIYDYSWGYFPIGGPLHKAHCIFLIITAVFSLYLLARGMIAEKKSHGKTQLYYETKYLFLAFLFVTLAAVDLLPNMGIDIFPPGFIFIAVFIYSITYAIFKHNLMGVSIIIKKSLIYSILISSIVAFYFLGIYLIGITLKDWANIHSLPLMLVLLTTITLISRPLERRITRYVDRLFFKKPLDVMEKENQLLYLEIQKQDHLRAVALFASGMAHEIKNPLATIRTFAEYLPKKYDDPAFREKFQKMVIEEVDRVNGIVKQLLDFSKPQPPRLEPIQVNLLLADTLDPLSDNFIRSKVSVERKFAGEMWIRGDKNQLKQVFLNLFLNAIQAMPAGGILTVQTSAPDPQTLMVSVSDSGEGIGKDRLPYIFEPFFTTKESGTGLGLSIVKEIVLAHQGKVWAESMRGEGTTIYLNFTSLPKPLESSSRDL